MRGFTLSELLGALTILAIVAALAIPSFTAGDAVQKLELAATEISHALQFVRSEAIRTGKPHALHSESNGQITLHTLDTSGIAPVLDEILRHPVSKQNYQFNVLTASNTSGIALSDSNPPFNFESPASVSISSRDVYFTANGAPHYIDGSGVYYRLTTGNIGLSSDGFQRSVSLAPINGRVAVQ
ncbi:MAG: pilus assembly FimT family protein [Pseudomonadales bacterium]